MRVVLRRSAWHYRLQHFVFGEVPFTTNFCPYFWLTVFCLAAFPALLLGRGLVTLLKPAARKALGGLEILGNKLDKLSEAIDRRICRPRFERIVRNLPIEKAYALHCTYNSRWHGQSLRDLKLYDAWISLTPDWKERIRFYHEQYMTRVLSKKTKDKSGYLTLIKISKVFVYGLATLLTIAVIYGITLLVGNILNRYTLSELVLGGIQVALILVLGTAGVIAFLGLGILAAKALRCLSWSCITMPSPVVKAGRGVGEFFSFFIDYLANFKKNHCPGIEWEK